MEVEIAKKREIEMKAKGERDKQIYEQKQENTKKRLEELRAQYKSVDSQVEPNYNIPDHNSGNRSNRPKPPPRKMTLDTQTTEVVSYDPNRHGIPLWKATEEISESGIPKRSLNSRSHGAYSSRGSSTNADDNDLPEESESSESASAPESESAQESASASASLSASASASTSASTSTSAPGTSQPQKRVFERRIMAKTPADNNTINWWQNRIEKAGQPEETPKDLKPLRKMTLAEDSTS